MACVNSPVFGVENNIEKSDTLYGCQPPSTRDILVKTPIYDKN
jgi:hypothetical protein